MSRPVYSLVFEVRDSFLHAAILGKEDSYETTLGAVTEVAAVCRERKLNKVLVEHAIPGKLTPLEIWKIASQLPEIYRGITVAFVVHLTSLPDNPEFLESVARNRGGEGRLFRDAREAEAWLRSV
jgi:hypothetical protein